MNKQIIIDGKECKYWFKPNPTDYRRCSLRGQNYNCDEIDDCFIKELLGKLKRKEQECNNLQSELDFAVQQKECLEQKFDQLKAENEKLKEKFKKFFNIDNQECWNIAFLNNENERYKQALDGIEEYLKTQLDGFGNAVYSVEKSAITKILDIINKAKDGE